MSEEAELLAAIAAAPDDDAPRLVLADLLSSRGDPRGELIVLQCRLVGMDPDDPAAPPVRDRVRKLLEAGWKAYAGELAPYASPYAFGRGFVGTVTMTIAAFAKHGPRLFATYPLHTLVVSNDKWIASALDKLVRVPVELRGLELHARADTVSPLAPLGKGAHFGRLERLALGGCGHTPADWKQLFERIAAPRLATLELSSIRSSASIVAAIASNPALSSLRELELSVRDSLDHRGAKRTRDAHAALASTVALERLAIAHDDNVDDVALAAYFARDAAATLRSLKIEGCATTHALWRTIARSPKVTALEAVELRDHRELPLDGIAAVLASATALRHLAITSYGGSEESTRALERLLLALPVDHPLKTVVVPYPHGSPELHARFRVVG